MRSSASRMSRFSSGAGLSLTNRFTRTLNQKLKGCDPQPFIVDMQASPR